MPCLMVSSRVDYFPYSAMHRVGTSGIMSKMVVIGTRRMSHYSLPCFHSLTGLSQMPLPNLFQAFTPWSALFRIKLRHVFQVFIPKSALAQISFPSLFQTFTHWSALFRIKSRQFFHVFIPKSALSRSGSD